LSASLSCPPPLCAAPSPPCRRCQGSMGCLACWGCLAAPGPGAEQRICSRHRRRRRLRTQQSVTGLAARRAAVLRAVQPVVQEELVLCQGAHFGQGPNFAHSSYAESRLSAYHAAHVRYRHEQPHVLHGIWKARQRILTSLKLTVFAVVATSARLAGVGSYPLAIAVSWMVSDRGAVFGSRLVSWLEPCVQSPSQGCYCTSILTCSCHKLLQLTCRVPSMSTL
jgi:hypothetical protein